MLNAILELVASDLICLLHRKDKFAEALEAEYLVQELVETYSRALLPQVSWSRLCTDRFFFHIASKRFAPRMRKNRVLGLNSQALLGAISQSWTPYKDLDGSVFLLCTSIRFPARWLQVLDLNGHKKAGTWSEDALSKSSLSSAGTWLCGTFSRHSLAGTFLALTLSGTFQQMNCLVRACSHNKVAI